MLCRQVVNETRQGKPDKFLLNIIHIFSTFFSVSFLLIYRAFKNVYYFDFNWLSY